MDLRTPLEKNTVLHFPGMECVIGSCCGRGANIMAYTGRYRDHLDPSLSHLVLIRELFPYDPQGRIRRAADGSIMAGPSAEALYSFHRMTFLRGNEVHIRLAESIPSEIDMNINTFAYNNTLYSLLAFSGGRTLEEDAESIFSAETAGAAGGRKDSFLRAIRIIKGTLMVLEAFHQRGFLHLDISPDNILLVGEGEKERVTLIDYNSVHTIEEIEGHADVYFSVKEGYTAPEVRMGRSGQMGAWTDLYSMAAVFYSCLSGHPLTPVQQVGSAPVGSAAADLPYLSEYPASVQALVRSILKKGLSVSLGRRYQTTGQMLADLTELEDRINGRGITHWALWESGRAGVRRILDENTALAFVKEDQKIFPLAAVDESGESFDLLEDPGTVFSKSAKARLPVLLLGGGGTGKTTALLRIACRQKKRYSPQSPAVFYISLYGCREGDPHFICDRILDRLKFKPHTDSMESARRELMQLLDKSAAGTSGRQDSPLPFLLLLDGLNEVTGDTGPLLEEIHALSVLRGVQIILTSRSDPGDGRFQKLMIQRLEPALIRKTLAKEGILPPESMEAFDLLGFPMLLSLYVRTVRDGEKHIRLRTREDLLDAYFSSLLEKEKRELPAESSAGAGIDAAVQVLLPEIAARTTGSGQAMTRQDLSKLVGEWYKELSGTAITAVYPDWIGHTAWLRMGCADADEWYGKAVLALLWRKLGLLVRDERGDFCPSHQIIEDYLARKNRDFHKKYDREKRIRRNWRAVLTAAALFALVFFLYSFYSSQQDRIRSQSREILLNESMELASSSAERLAAGDREGALRDALKALPAGGSTQSGRLTWEETRDEKPLPAAAQKALADALYLYQEDAYFPTKLLELDSAPVRTAMDREGRILLAVEEKGQSGLLRCMDCRAGEERWKVSLPWVYDSEKQVYDYGKDEEDSVEDYAFPVLRILENSSAVFCAGEKEEAALYSLDTGDLLWKISYEDLPFPFYNRVGLAEISQDEKTLVLGILDRHKTDPENENLADESSPDEKAKEYEYIKRLFFFDMATGEEILRSGSLTEDTGLYCSFTGKGCFSADDQTFFCELDSSGSGHPADTRTLVSVDVRTGKVTGSFSAKKDPDIDNQRVSAVIRSDTGGVFYYLCEYDRNSPEAGLVKTVNIGYVPDGASSWSFYRSCPLIGDASRLPFMTTREGSLYLFSGKDIVCIGPDGQERRADVTDRILYACRDKDGGEVGLVFEKGGTGSCFLPGLSIYEDGDSSHILGGGPFVLAAGTGSWKKPFCVFPADRPSRAVLCEYLQEEDSRMILKEEDPLSGNVYSLPGEDRFLLLNEESLPEQSDPSSSSYMYRLYGKIYGMEGENLDNFSFDLPVSAAASEPVFSSDGEKMLCGHHLCDLKSHTVTDLSGAFPKDLFRVYIGSTILKDRFLTVCTDDGKSLWLSRDGDPAVEIPMIRDRDADPSSDTGFAFAHAQYDVFYDHVFHFEELITGENGLVVLAGTEGKETAAGQAKGRPVDYYQVYSIEEDKWARLPAGSDTRGFPALCAASREKWFASFDEDHRLIVYDPASEASRSFTVPGIDLADIEKMQFILEDEYILFSCRKGDEAFYQAVRLADGETVFRYTAKEKYVYGGLSVCTDEEQGRIFLFNGGSNLTGCCVDAKTWEPLFYIPSLRCVLKNRTCITLSVLKGMKQRPVFTLEELIMKGSRILED